MEPAMILEADCVEAMAQMDEGAPRSPMKRRRKPMKRSSKSIGASSDKLWSKVVRAAGECERCGRTSDEGVLHAHHVYGRGFRRLRWEPRNGCCLCFKCHRLAEEHSREFDRWFSKARPDDATYLDWAYQLGPLKRTTTELLQVEKSLKERLDEAAR